MSDAGKRFELRGKRVWVAGHRGMVGSALMRRLKQSGCTLLTADRSELDLTRQRDVEAWMATSRPQAIFIAAARVGGIEANSTRPADFAYDNIAIAINIIGAAARCGVEKLMFLGSACIYPRLAAQPMTEAQLMTGPLEPSNEAYALAKLSGIGLCRSYRRQHDCDFISVVPTNLYGPGDNLDPAASHVVPALIGKVLQAKACAGTVEIWGSGTPRREFLHVDDAADAMVFLMKSYSSEAIINVGGGDVVSIRELAGIVADVVGFTGPFHCDTTRIDGMPRKQLDAGRLFALGWRPSIKLRDGLVSTCEWFAASPNGERSVPGSEWCAATRVPLKNGEISRDMLQ
jgi:GDP-L-fucose synthase